MGVEGWTSDREPCGYVSNHSSISSITALGQEWCWEGKQWCSGRDGARGQEDGFALGHGMNLVITENVRESHWNLRMIGDVY